MSFMTCTEFIKQHNYINYCEIIISTKGYIQYARPSHLLGLLSMGGYSMEEISKIMPERAHPLKWLVEYTGYCVCWYDYCIAPTNYTKKQLAIVKRLVRHNIMKKDSIFETTNEKSICDLLSIFDKTGDNSILNKIKESNENKKCFLVR